MISLVTAAAVVLQLSGSAAAVEEAGASASVRAVPARLARGGPVPVTVEGDCRLHLLDSAGTERVVACGVDEQVPAAEYRAWIEQGRTEMSAPSLLSLQSGTRELLLLPLEAAGRVRVSGAPADAQVMLLRVGPSEGPLFLRSVAADAVRMPVGDVIAIAFDRDGDAVRLSPRKHVQSGRQIELALEAPRRAGLVAIYKHVAAAASATLTLHAGESTVIPEAIASGSDAVMSIWSAAPGGAARLIAQSEELFAPEQELVLREGRVATVRAVLQRRPSLEVAVRSSAGVELPPMKLTVRRAGGPTLKQQQVARGDVVTFERMPAGPVEALLQVGPWTLRREADLSDGRDRAVSFELEPFEIAGRVRYGSDAARAKVTFRIDGETSTIDTDGEGRYSIGLWRRGFYSVDVLVAARAAAAPYREMLRLSGSRTLDLEVPRTSIVLRVVDDTTSKPVEGARVTLVSSWSENGAPLRKTQDVLTPASGEVECPPLREGTVELHVMAEGYEHASHPPMQLAGGQPVEVEMRLRPHAAVGALTLVLPSGAPAAGAELLALSREAHARVLWRGAADATGVVRVPDQADGALLMARHPEAASGARLWRKGDARVPWRLAVAAPPLLVEVRPAASRAAQLVVWIDGQPLHGIALAFATRAFGNTGPNGRATLAGLPAAPTRMLAVRHASEERVASGAYDAVATAIPFPWPAGAVAVDVVE